MAASQGPPVKFVKYCTKYFKYINANDHSAQRSTRILNSEQDWTPCQKGFRTSRAGIPEAGLPAEGAHFREACTLFTSPGQSTTFPYECFNDPQALQDLELQVDDVKGHATP